MTAFTFDVPYSDPVPEDYVSARRRQFETIAESRREAERMAEEAEARRAEERLITLRMPTEMIERLDLIAKDADVSRSQLIRQIAADFINYVWVNGVRFRGSLLGFKHRQIADREEE